VTSSKDEDAGLLRQLVVHHAYRVVWIAVTMPFVRCTYVPMP
jgi:hypothetical protein